MIGRRAFLAASLMSLASTALPGPARAAGRRLRIGSVKFGSLSWLIETVRAEGLDKAAGLELEIIDVASNQAGPVALLSSGADIIVSDWTWAMRQRGLGEKLKFSPYSSALGSLVVPNDSPIKTIGDLKGRTLGIAGSAIDKSWLLLRAYSRTTLGRDIAELADTSFGAAPLLTEEIRAGRVDAVLNFWTYAARLTGSGFKSILDMSEVMAALGIEPVPPLVGFVWKESFAAEHEREIELFLKVVTEANEILATSDAAWERLRPLIRAQSDAELEGLMAAYRAGVPGPWGDAEMRAAEQLMNVLIEAGDKELVGAGTHFDAKLFRHAES